MDCEGVSVAEIEDAAQDAALEQFEWSYTIDGEGPCT